MKTKDLRDIRKQSLKKLNKLLSEKREELDKAKMDLAAGQEQNVKKVKQIKKDVAQVLTIIREKELVANMNAENKQETEKKSGKSHSSSGKKGEDR